MKLGISTYTYMWSIGFENARPEWPMSLFDVLEQAKRLGVAVVQIGPNLPLPQIGEPNLTTFLERAADLDIEFELATRGLEYDHLVRQMHLAKRLRAKLLRTIPEIEGRPVDAHELSARARAVLPVFEREGVQLAIENGRIPARELANVFDDLKSPLLGAVLDTVNSLAISEGWKHVAEILAPYTMCLHLKEFIIKRAWHMMGFVCEGRPTGQGQLDVPCLLERCKESKHDFNVIIELWPPEQRSLDETILVERRWAEESIAYTRRYVPN
jgi:sugar phosphate isomerase/epimerase